MTANVPSEGVVVQVIVIQTYYYFVAVAAVVVVVVAAAAAVVVVVAAFVEVCVVASFDIDLKDDLDQEKVWKRYYYCCYY